MNLSINILLLKKLQDNGINFTYLLVIKISVLNSKRYSYLKTKTLITLSL